MESSIYSLLVNAFSQVPVAGAPATLRARTGPSRHVHVTVPYGNKKDSIDNGVRITVGHSRCRPDAGTSPVPSLKRRRRLYVPGARAPRGASKAPRGGSEADFDAAASGLAAEDADLQKIASERCRPPRNAVAPSNAVSALCGPSV